MTPERKAAYRHLIECQKHEQEALLLAISTTYSTPEIRAAAEEIVTTAEHLTAKAKELLAVTR